MAAVADLKFTQGPNTDTAGRAVVGTLTDGVCNITNGDNTDIANWEIELLYTPPGSAVVPAVLATAVDNTPTASFTPDVPGCYRIRERVYDTFGVLNEDIRNFAVPNFRGIIIPPYQNDPLPIDVSLKDDELNFGGQAFGWAGDRVVGLFEKYFETDRDLISVTVTATPFTAVAQEADVYLVDTTAIGSSVFNLPAAARNGQAFLVADDKNDAYNNPIAVTVPAGDQFEDGSTVRNVFANGALIQVMKVSGTQWRILKNTAQVVYLDLLASLTTTSNNGFTRVSSVLFNPDSYPADTVFFFQAVMETSDASHAHDVQLYNLTTASVVSSPLSTASLLPSSETDELVAPTDLAAGDNLYELQHKMATGISPDAVTLSAARLLIVFAQTG